jgi:hypothetical protein
VCFRVICCWSHCVFLTILLLPCFSPSVKSNPSAPQPSSLFLSFGYIKPIQRHKPSQRRFLVFLLRLSKKTETKKRKKEKERERIEPENKQKIGKGRKQSGCLISVGLHIT